MAGEKKHSSSRAAAAANDNEDANTRTGLPPLEEERVATTMDDGPLLGTGHSSRAQGCRSVPLTAGGGAFADEGNGRTVDNEGDLIPWVDLWHRKQ